MFKSLYLPLIGVALFVALVGYFSKNPSKFGVPTVSPKPTLDSLATQNISVNDFQITVNLANNETARARGLSGISSLKENEGMLFKFDKPDLYPVFWMKDMVMPIDIIWINDGKITKIDKNVQPEPGKKDSELTKYTAPSPTDFVLEIGAGVSDKKGIKVGQTLSGL